MVTPLGFFKREKLSLAGIRREMQDMAKPGVPDAVESSIHEAAALRSIQRWKEPFEAYITQTKALLDTMFKQVLEVRNLRLLYLWDTCVLHHCATVGVLATAKRTPPSYWP